jgi:AraC-like DNA-binding protein
LLPSPGVVTLGHMRTLLMVLFDEGVEQTARSCGYGTPEAMRRAFVRTLGVSPDEYRRRFRPAAIAQGAIAQG